MNSISQNWPILRDRIEQAAHSAGRASDDIEVIAVSKTRTAQEVEAAHRCGLTLVGENRVQEAEGKKAQVAAPLSWHMIGHLQSNKANKAVQLFDVVQSVDRFSLAQALDRRAQAVGRQIEVMLQVNTADSASQSGAHPDQVVELAGRVAELPSLEICGLMTIGAHSDDEHTVRASFARLRGLGESVDADIEKVSIRHLSMGMSGDFEWAIAEGSTMLRLGTALFGARA